MNARIRVGDYVLELDDRIEDVDEVDLFGVEAGADEDGENGVDAVDGEGDGE